VYQGDCNGSGHIISEHSVTEHQILSNNTNNTKSTDTTITTTGTNNNNDVITILLTAAACSYELKNVK